ncbi:hypothetical protein [Microbacterium sp. 77mftsu3.1]|uniref:hypothetical protein n=1 Tax=Microbacterium sp. 77mftsu3.1 TaxID=1761802 RepID=UPI0003757E52|nr:hypothetical protein [Microbacterium sp. 77mftsu3.1]SDH55169.1 hypothetical protein SAMN04488590_3553 [Microbacterium sp. 77mftsu3.1]
MTALTFGDTFTLPSTGDLVWTIVDDRPTHYVDASSRPYTARVQTDGYVVRYGPESGWYALYSTGVRRASGDQPVIAELEALEVRLPRRSEQECEHLELDRLAAHTRARVDRLVDETRIGTAYYLGARAYPIHHEHLAHVAAIASVHISGGEEGDVQYLLVYNATLAALRENALPEEER